MKGNNATGGKYKVNGQDVLLSKELIDYKDGLSLVKINLKTGRSHQIRVQFSSRNMPLYSDMKYNPKAIKGNICLVAKELSIFHPTTKEELTFKIDLPNTYPWNIFTKKDDYQNHLFIYKYL